MNSIIPKKRSHRVLLVALCLLVVVGAVAGVLLVRSRNAVVTQTQVDALRLRVRDLDNQKKYDESMAAIQKVQARKMTNSNRAQVDGILATHYILLKDYKHIIEWTQKAVELDPRGLTYPYARTLAEAYIGLGDKKTAVEYLNKAIKAAQTDSDTSNDIYIESMQLMIASLDPANSANAAALNSATSNPAAVMFKQEYDKNAAH